FCFTLSEGYCCLSLPPQLMRTKNPLLHSQLSMSPAANNSPGPTLHSVLPSHMRFTCDRNLGPIVRSGGALAQAILASSTCFIFLADAESAVEIVAQTIMTTSPKNFRMTNPSSVNPSVNT